MNSFAHNNGDDRPIDRALYDRALGEGFAIPPPRKYDGPIVDMHTHANDVNTGAPLFEAARLYGIRRLATIAPLEAGADLQRRFSEAAVVPWLRWDGVDDAARFAAENVRIVQEAAAAGAPMIKLWFAPRFFDRYDVRMDDARLDAVFAEIGRHKLGVIVHIADPDLWFERVYTDVARYGTKASQYVQLENRLQAHRDIPVLVAHMGGNPEHLDEVERLLDRHPNMYIDTSATRWIVRELGKQPETARRFFKRNKERILFGTDQVATKEPEQYRYTSRYWIHSLFWETDVVVPLAIDDPDSDGEPLLRGIDLPAEVLPWIYHRNAERVFGVKTG